MKRVEKSIMHVALEYLSLESYIKHAKKNATRCPNCKSDAYLDCESTTQVTDDEVDCEVLCTNCGCAWTEEYHLTSYYGVTHTTEER